MLCLWIVVYTHESLDVWIFVVTIIYSLPLDIYGVAPSILVAKDFHPSSFWILLNLTNNVNPYDPDNSLTIETFILLCRPCPSLIFIWSI